MNWDRWMLERLPDKLRTVIMFTLCMVYVAFIRRLYDEFVEWKRRVLVKLSGTPQVCVLKKVVYDELGVNIEIEEGDGKPYDFIVKTDINDMNKERQLHALLDKYKLAGKSYRYINSEVGFVKEWGTFICERATMIIGWDRYICEHKIRPVNHLYCTYLKTVIRVTPEFPVASDLLVRFLTGAERPGPVADYSNGFVSLKKGTVGTVYGSWINNVEPVTACVYGKVPEDETYKYEIVWR